MNIEDRHLKIVLDILHKHAPDCEVWVFGSRVHSRNLKKFSDLDLALHFPDNLPIATRDKIMRILKEEFEESNLPFTVDILDWDAISQNFQAIIAREYEIIKKPSNFPVNSSSDDL